MDPDEKRAREQARRADPETGDRIRAQDAARQRRRMADPAKRDERNRRRRELRAVERRRKLDRDRKRRQRADPTYKEREKARRRQRYATDHEFRAAEVERIRRFRAGEQDEG